VKEVWIKTITSPEICCRTLLWKERGRQYSFTFCISENSTLYVRRHLFYRVLFAYLFFSSW